jgi:hypothetical protein
MPFANYQASFASVLPALRSREAIASEIGLCLSGKAPDVARSAMAEIELHIHDGDTAYRNKRYPAALQEFQLARALIYKLLHPKFDIAAYVAQPSFALPISQDIETDLFTLTSRIADVIRPSAVAPGLIFSAASGNPAPDVVEPFLTTGFRETASADETLQRASLDGIRLLKDGRAEAALGVMNDALATNVSRAPVLTAALQLNIACAQLQLGDPRSAVESATASIEGFRGSEDRLGEAQALHIAGIGSSQAGNVREAERFLAEAAGILEDVTIPEFRQPTPPGASTFDGATVSVALSAHTLTASTAAPLRTLGPQSALLATRDPSTLKSIRDKDVQVMTFRVAGRSDGWGALPLMSARDVQRQAKAWQVGVPMGRQIVLFEVGGATPLVTADLIGKLYQPRIGIDRYIDAGWKIIDTSTTTAYLTHLYGFVLPVKIGDAYRENGLFARAEEHYVQAAAYSYLNRDVEGTSLWIRIARNALEWGNAHYKAENIEGAKTQYEKLITSTGGEPASLLYTTPSLDVPAGAARDLVQNISVSPLPDVNWDISYSILTAYSYLNQIAQGLDFFGLLLSPIHTFEYLQTIARGFAREAIEAEREFVNFESQQEAEQANRRELLVASAMAAAEVEARFQQYSAAQADTEAAEAALTLANKRKIDAQQQKNDYAATSSRDVWARAAAAALGGGSDAWFHEISELADKLDRGETISGPAGKLAAAQTMSAGRRTQKYELEKMQNNIDELAAAVPVAQAQLDGSRAREESARLGWEAAKQRASMAQAALEAFDDEFFTPDTWAKMAEIMRDISRSYLERAIRIAKLMERAYNFENDAHLKIIRAEYGYSVAAASPGRNTQLLGGDGLLNDIESFTFNAITTRTRKSSRIKDVISLSADFPAQFEQFRRTGLLAFETDLYEFDRLHPGYWGQRIETVEIEIIGVLPESGLNGTLSAGGVTGFRRRDGSAGTRTHVVDTMALSNFVLRNDGFAYQAETGVRGLFQGIGLGSTWQLQLPKRSNDFDFRRIFDVRLILYYTAQFDTALRANVLAAPTRPDELARLKSFTLRFDFSDAWYAFYKAGIAQVLLDEFRLPMNQKNFKTNSVNFRIVTAAGVSPQDIDVRITGPNGTVGTVKTNADGLLSTAGGPLAGIAGSNPIGTWKIEVLGGPSVMDGASIRFERIANVQMGLDYTFDYVEEAL